MESKREMLRTILERIVNEGARNQMLTEEIIHLRAEVQSLKAKIDTLTKQPFYYADMTPLPGDRFPIEEDNLPKKRFAKTKKK